MEQSIQPNGIVSNDISSIDKKGSKNSLWIIIVVFSLICVAVATLLILFKFTNSFGSITLEQQQIPLIDPLAMSDPTNGIAAFLNETLQPDFLPKNSIVVTKIADQTYQYKWNEGNIFYTSRIFMQNPIESTNSGQTKVGMILLAIQLQTDHKMDLDVTKEYVARYFQPITLSNPKWSEYDDSENNVGRVISLKGDNLLGSRDWRGIVENPKNQAGPIYLYSLQACRIFPESANFERYKCISN